MISLFPSKFNLYQKMLSAVVGIAFLGSSIVPPSMAQSLPAGQAGVLMPSMGLNLAASEVSQVFSPILMRGVMIHPEDSLKFDFIIEKGSKSLTQEAFNKEANKLIKYFLASLTIPENQMWVNLSPYEKDRIIPNEFGRTEMGRDLLAQDYILKQLTASLLMPEGDVGRRFWERVHAQAKEKFGTTEVPLETFNKIWIVPENAKVYENEKGAFVVRTHLKVLLEEDYLALEANQHSNEHGLGDIQKETLKPLTKLQTEVLREVIIPEIEKEVNEGETFTNLRQIYYSMVLAAWYKQALRESLLSKVYVDKAKTNGVNINDPKEIENIYNQYVDAFQKGMTGIVKEEYDANSQEIISKKYVTGGMNMRIGIDALQGQNPVASAAMATATEGGNMALVKAEAAMISDPDPTTRTSLDNAMSNSKSGDDSKNFIMPLRTRIDILKQILEKWERKDLLDQLKKKKIKTIDEFDELFGEIRRSEMTYISTFGLRDPESIAAPRFLLVADLLGFMFMMDVNIVSMEIEEMARFASMILSSQFFLSFMTEKEFRLLDRFKKNPQNYHKRVNEIKVVLERICRRDQPLGNTSKLRHDRVLAEIDAIAAQDEEPWRTEARKFQKLVSTHHGGSLDSRKGTFGSGRSELQAASTFVVKYKRRFLPPKRRGKSSKDEAMTIARSEAGKAASISSRIGLFSTPITIKDFTRIVQPLLNQVNVEFGYLQYTPIYKTKDSEGTWENYVSLIDQLKEKLTNAIQSMKSKDKLDIQLVQALIDDLLDIRQRYLEKSKRRIILEDLENSKIEEIKRSVESAIDSLGLLKVLGADAAIKADEDIELDEDWGEENLGPELEDLLSAIRQAAILFDHTERPTENEVRFKELRGLEIAFEAYEAKVQQILTRLIVQKRFDDIRKVLAVITQKIESLGEKIYGAKGVEKLEQYRKVIEKIIMRSETSRVIETSKVEKSSDEAQLAPNEFRNALVMKVNQIVLKRGPKFPERFRNTIDPLELLTFQEMSDMMVKFSDNPGEYKEDGMAVIRYAVEVLRGRKFDIGFLITAHAVVDRLRQGDTNKLRLSNGEEINAAQTFKGNLDLLIKILRFLSSLSGIEQKIVQRLALGSEVYVSPSLQEKLRAMQFSIYKDEFRNIILSLGENLWGNPLPSIDAAMTNAAEVSPKMLTFIQLISLIERASNLIDLPDYNIERYLEMNKQILAIMPNAKVDVLFHVLNMLLRRVGLRSQNNVFDSSGFYKRYGVLGGEIFLNYLNMIRDALIEKSHFQMAFYLEIIDDVEKIIHDSPQGSQDIKIELDGKEAFILIEDLERMRKYTGRIIESLAVAFLINQDAFNHAFTDGISADQLVDLKGFPLNRHQVLEIFALGQALGYWKVVDHKGSPELADINFEMIMSDAAELAFDNEISIDHVISFFQTFRTKLDALAKGPFSSKAQRTHDAVIEYNKIFEDLFSYLEQVAELGIYDLEIIYGMRAYFDLFIAEVTMPPKKAVDAMGQYLQDPHNSSFTFDARARFEKRPSYWKDMRWQQNRFQAIHEQSVAQSSQNTITEYFIFFSLFSPRTYYVTQIMRELIELEASSDLRISDQLFQRMQTVIDNPWEKPDRALLGFSTDNKILALATVEDVQKALTNLKQNLVVESRDGPTYGKIRQTHLGPKKTVTFHNYTLRANQWERSIAKDPEEYKRLVQKLNSPIFSSVESRSLFAFGFHLRLRDALLKVILEKVTFEDFPKLLEILKVDLKNTRYARTLPWLEQLTERNYPYFIERISPSFRSVFGFKAHVKAALLKVLEGKNAALQAGNLGNNQGTADPAALADNFTRGGIDLNPTTMSMQIERDGNGVPLPVNLQNLENLNIQGFQPVIINVVPITNLPLLLGLNPASSDPIESSKESLSVVDRFVRNPT